MMQCVVVMLHMAFGTATPSYLVINIVHAQGSVYIQSHLPLRLT